MGRNTFPVFWPHDVGAAATQKPTWRIRGKRPFGRHPDRAADTGSRPRCSRTGGCWPAGNRKHEGVCWQLTYICPWRQPRVYATTAGKIPCVNNQNISSEFSPIASSPLDKVCQKTKYVANEILKWELSFFSVYVNASLLNPCISLHLSKAWLLRGSQSSQTQVWHGTKKHDETEYFISSFVLLLVLFVENHFLFIKKQNISVFGKIESYSIPRWVHFCWGPLTLKYHG